MPKFINYIGLEVHIQLLTETKIFCKCRTSFGEKPNTNICPVCMGYPGTLPSLNRKAVHLGCITAKALNCSLSKKTLFDRKHYFYPDMPKNFQITQYASPLGINGYFDIIGKDGLPIKHIRIKECHLEEDSGKMIHSGDVSLLDYNRAGVPLLEIVTEPDLETGEEAEIFIQQLRRMVRFLGVCDGNMENGSLRADANVSVNIQGCGLGKKVELKNLNSSRHIKLGLNYEITRQSQILIEGKTVTQETMLWNDSSGETSPMRSKENANDYRYMPEPDLPVIIVNDNLTVPELPIQRAKRLSAEYGLSFEQADLICEEKALADYFEEAAAGISHNTQLLIANWLLQDVKHLLAKKGIEMNQLKNCSLSPKRLSDIAAIAAAGKISSKNARQLIELVFTEDMDPKAIIQKNGWELISDPAIIDEAIQRVFASEAVVVAEAKNADTYRRQKLCTWLTGKVLSATNGKADPIVVKDFIEKELTNC